VCTVQRHVRFLVPGAGAAVRQAAAASLSLPDPGRSSCLQVPAGARTTRFVNPHAYGRGTVFMQCEGCAVWHQLVDNMGLIEEYRFPRNAKAERGRMGDTDHTSALNSDDE
jgi:DNL zinc finger